MTLTTTALKQAAEPRAEHQSELLTYRLHRDSVEKELDKLSSVTSDAGAGYLIGFRVFHTSPELPTVWNHELNVPEPGFLQLVRTDSSRTYLGYAPEPFIETWTQFGQEERDPLGRGGSVNLVPPIFSAFIEDRSDRDSPASAQDELLDHLLTAIEQYHPAVVNVKSLPVDDIELYDEATWKRAVKLIRSFVGDCSAEVTNLGVPTVLPGPENDIDILWRCGRKKLLINLPSDASEPVTFHGDDSGNPNRELMGQVEIDDDNLWLLRWLTG